MIFMVADWDWWIKKKFSQQLTRKHRVQGMFNVTSSSSQLLSSTSLTVSWKAWLTNEITPHLQRHNFVRKTNQGTPQHFCEKMQHWYLKIFTRTTNTLPTTRWRDMRIIREIIFTSSSELTSETWIIIRQWKIQVSLKSRINFISCLEDQGCFQNPPESHFSNYPPPPPPRPSFSRDFM